MSSRPKVAVAAADLLELRTRLQAANVLGMIHYAIQVDNFHRRLEGPRVFYWRNVLKLSGFQLQRVLPRLSTRVRTRAPNTEGYKYLAMSDATQAIRRPLQFTNACLVDCSTIAAQPRVCCPGVTTLMFYALKFYDNLLTRKGLDKNEAKRPGRSG